MDFASNHALPSSLIHDLRTPLNHIIGYSELLITQAQESGEQRSVPDLETIHTAGMKLLTMMSDNFYPIGAVPASETLAAEASERADRVDHGVATQALLDYAVVEDRASRVAKGSCLVVDDNEANRELLVRRLEGDGYAASVAQDGVQALEMLRAGTFDLVLLDIMMPEVDGYEVLHVIKTDPLLQHIPVVMISALTELESVARCIEMGAEDYLPKPFNPTLLKARVTASLEKKRAHDRETLLFEQLQRNFTRLQTLERLRDDLTHMIVHDLRTPLTSVISGMQTLSALGEMNSGQREVMNIAVAGGDALLSMINDLLDVEKLEGGTMKLDKVELSVDELVRSALGQVESLAKERGLKLTMEIASDIPTIRGDEGKLIRTLVNLLGNAIKFTPGGGTVTVRAHVIDEGRSVEFLVCDTGEGIPPEAFGRIFEKFGQVESRKEGRNMSTGLGLTFCKLAVEAHGGHIGVESEPGRGSSFSFTIPLDKAFTAKATVL
ncbi:MAG TPA: response regulator [Fimbriimonadaceae bacterium]|nr:response regulator [Fimbriimonadaceae bacterium]